MRRRLSRLAAAVAFVVPPPAGVPFANVKFLSHADNAAASTVIVDQLGGTVTPNSVTGGAVSSSQSRFPGGNSWDTRGGLDLLSVPDFNTGDFMIQLSVLCTSGSGGGYEALLAASISTGFWQYRIAISGGNYIFSVCNQTPGVEFTITGPAPTVGSWDDIACTRNGNLFELWINGVSVGNATYTGNLYNSGTQCTLNGFYLGGSFIPRAGTYVDEIRFANAFFTPTALSAPFPNS